LGKLFTHACLCSPSSIIWYRSKGDDAPGWEGNRRSASHWPCATDLSGLSTYGLKDLRKRDEHPAYTPVGVWHLYLFTYYWAWLNNYLTFERAGRMKLRVVVECRPDVFIRSHRIWEPAQQLTWLTTAHFAQRKTHQTTDQAYARLLLSLQHNDLHFRAWVGAD